LKLFNKCLTMLGGIAMISHTFKSAAMEALAIGAVGPYYWNHMVNLLISHLLRMVSSGMLRRVALVRTDVLEEPGATSVNFWYKEIMKHVDIATEFTVTVCQSSSHQNFPCNTIRVKKTFRKMPWMLVANIISCIC
jgi:hypothetical protein